MQWISRLILNLLGILFLVFGAFLLFMTFGDTKPKEVVRLPVENRSPQVLELNKPISIVTFNIGYCGLDKKQDFFMDGGKMSRSRSKEQTMKNLKNITQFLTSGSPSFILLQEVDISSTRSFHINQLAYMRKNLPGYGTVFGWNYKVIWVPVPVLRPMGSVYSGLTTFSRYKINTATRYQYPGREKWPRQVFDLDRCFVENRIPVNNGKELILINSHLSAFDKGGKIRRKQLAYLKRHIVEEYRKGNYVIVGGDWNHVLPGTDPKDFATTESWPAFLQYLPEGFTPPGFKWGVDPSTPTVRTSGTEYVEGKNFRAVIDGFLVSPNIKIEAIKGHNLRFENSDHNPVSGVFFLQATAN